VLENARHYLFYLAPAAMRAKQGVWFIIQAIQVFMHIEYVVVIQKHLQAAGIPC